MNRGFLKTTEEPSSWCSGRSAKEANLYTEICEGIHPYGITRHRHGNSSIAFEAFQVCHVRPVDWIFGLLMWTGVPTWPAITTFMFNIDYLDVWTSDIWSWDRWTTHVIYLPLLCSSWNWARAKWCGRLWGYHQLHSKPNAHGKHLLILNVALYNGKWFYCTLYLEILKKWK